MTIRTAIQNGVAITLMCAAMALPVFAEKKPKPDKTTGEKMAMVDSGTLGVYVNGTRVATETFRVEQGSSSSIVVSEFKMDQGMKVQQSSELRMSSNGDLQKYSLKETSPGKIQAVVEPSGDFLMERVTPEPPEKPSEVALLSPLSTAVLEDYSFSHREVLIWRYMAQACGSTIQSQCALPKATYGVLVPRQRTQASVSVEYRGKEKVNVKGAEKTLDLFTINMEGDAWSVYMDDDLKLVKIVVPSDKTEVVRD